MSLDTCDSKSCTHSVPFPRRGIAGVVYMRIALLHMIALLVGGVLDEEEVVVGIACDCSVKVVADTRQTKNILRFRMFDSLACH